MIWKIFCGDVFFNEITNVMYRLIRCNTGSGYRTVNWKHESVTLSSVDLKFVQCSELDIICFKHLHITYYFLKIKVKNR